MFARPGPDERRAGHDGNFATCSARSNQFRGELLDDGRLGFVRTDARVEELKDIRVRSRPLHRHNADSIVPHHDLVTFSHIKKLDRARELFHRERSRCPSWRAEPRSRFLSRG